MFYLFSRPVPYNNYEKIFYHRNFSTGFLFNVFVSLLQIILQNVRAYIKGRGFVFQTTICIAVYLDLYT